MRQSPIDFLETEPHNSFNKYSETLICLCFCLSTRHLINWWRKKEPARVRRWKDQLQLISNLWDTLKDSREKIPSLGGNVVFSLVRFVASIHRFFPPSKLETKKLPRTMVEISIGNWLEPFVIQLHPTTPGLRCESEKTLSQAIDYQFVSQKLFRDTFSRIEAWLRGWVTFYYVSEHSSIFHFGRITMAILTSIECRVLKYAFSHPLCFPKPSTLLDSRWQQIITIMMNISHFSSSPGLQTIRNRCDARESWKEVNRG